MAIDGTWNVTMQTPMGNREAQVTLKQDGDALTGTMSAEGQSQDVENGKVDGGTATWDANVTSPMPLTLSFTAELDGDNLNGTVKLGMFGNATFTGVPA